jgi:hypothetical protein
MTQHTPGPWAATEGYLWRGIRAPSRVIADMRIVGGVVENEVQANARLIAAAPDMLAALQDIADFWEEPTLSLWVLKSRVSAAIAKAKGAAA